MIPNSPTLVCGSRPALSGLVTAHAAKPICLLLLALAALWAAPGTAVAAAAAASSAERHLITDFGAVADGQTVNTKAIQSLIDRCASEGGGLVVVPKGAFLSGALFFKPGVNLLVEKDGVLKGTANPDDYPQVNTRWEGVERLWTCAFLNFDGMTNVQLSGEGMVDGSGDLWMQRGGGGGRGRGGAAPTNAPPAAQGDRGAAAANVSTNASGANSAARRGGGRPRLICFSNCGHVRIADLHLQRQAVWCLHILYSQDVVVSNINIRAIERIPSSDGMDIDSSRDVQITHCDIDCNDDDIAIKCGKDEDGLRVNRPSENITISDCAIGAGSGITMGSEVSGSIRHVLVERCKFTGSGEAARFKSQPSRGGVIEDIVYRDIQMDNARVAFEFNLSWRMVGPVVPPAKVLTVVSNVQFINFSGTAQTAGSISGLKDSPIKNIKFVNCKFTAQRGITVENAEDLDFSGLDVTVAQGDPIIRRDAAPQPQPPPPAQP
ncbi:MAG: glycosyl hydrolase family 28 protein [Verrucomicrobiota bacterium]|jgi:polygalacturonase